MRKDTRAHLAVYVEGQLSDLNGKNVEAIAKQAQVPVRTLQEFLSLLKWDHDRMRERLREIVMSEHAGKHAIGIIDETSFVKKGDKTPGVQRQHCGAVGKQENCIVMVHLGYAVGDFHCLLDGELFLPESWSEDRVRCEEVGIPEDMVYRPKWRVKDGEKGPMVWEVKHVLFDPKDAQGLPAMPYHLVVARNVLKPDEIKFFISNAPPETKVETLLLVGFSRWRVERCFEDQKSELGLDDYEGRRYLGLKRHLVLASVSHLFLAQVHQKLRGEKPGADRPPSPHRRRRARAILVA